MQVTAIPNIRTNPPTDQDVTWFGASQRLVGGQPDSRYGWLMQDENVLIVKAISPDLTAYASTLLQHERKMLNRLAKLNAPVPHLLELGRSDWLVTCFGGLSLQRLAHAGGLQGSAALPRFGFAERLSAWVHLLRRLQALADKGVLAIDLYSANVVLPLAGNTQGQLRLHEAALIDHAHTLEAGMDMRRPVWLNHGMKHIASELQQTLRNDQEALKAAFDLSGATLPGYSHLPNERDLHSRRVWAEYDAPQQLQQLLDQGCLSCDRAMQFAVGVSVNELLTLAPNATQQDALKLAAQRMTTPDARLRYPSLTAAAQALADVLETLPLASAHSYAPLKPQDLAIPASVVDVPVPQASALESELSTVMANHVGTQLPKQQNVNTDPLLAQLVVPQPYALPMRWLYLAASVAAACATLWPPHWG